MLRRKTGPLSKTGWGAIVRTGLLLVLSIRRACERAGRRAERIEIMEKAHDAQRRMRRIRPTDRSELPPAGVCPPVPDWSAGSRARACR